MIEKIKRLPITKGTPTPLSPHNRLLHNRLLGERPFLRPCLAGVPYSPILAGHGPLHISFAGGITPSEAATPAEVISLSSKSNTPSGSASGKVSKKWLIAGWITSGVLLAGITFNPLINATFIGTFLFPLEAQFSVLGAVGILASNLLLLLPGLAGHLIYKFQTHQAAKTAKLSAKAADKPGHMQEAGKSPVIDTPQPPIEISPEEISEISSSAPQRTMESDALSSLYSDLGSNDQEKIKNALKKVPEVLDTLNQETLIELFHRVNALAESYPDEASEAIVALLGKLQPEEGGK